MMNSLASVEPSGRRVAISRRPDGSTLAKMFNQSIKQPPQQILLLPIIADNNIRPGFDEALAFTRVDTLPAGFIAGHADGHAADFAHLLDFHETVAECQ